MYLPLLVREDTFNCVKAFAGNCFARISIGDYNINDGVFAVAVIKGNYIGGLQGDTMGFKKSGCQLRHNQKLIYYLFCDTIIAF